MTIDVTLQAKVDGGAPGLSATVPVDAVIQLTAANKDGYRTAYWQIWYYKAGYALPSGWTQIADDTGTPAFQVIGKADPPTFIASGYGGTWTCKLIAEDATGALVEGTDLIIRTAFANGLFPISAREQAQFGGAKASVVKTLNDDIELLDAVIGSSIASASNDAALDLGTASAGVSNNYSRKDHVHAHGNQLGGSLHAAASASAAGFLIAALWGAITGDPSVVGADRAILAHAPYNTKTIFPDQVNPAAAIESAFAAGYHVELIGGGTYALEKRIDLVDGLRLFCSSRVLAKLTSGFTSVAGADSDAGYIFRARSTIGAQAGVMHATAYAGGRYALFSFNATPGATYQLVTGDAALTANTGNADQQLKAGDYIRELVTVVSSTSVGGGDYRVLLDRPLAGTHYGHASTTPTTKVYAVTTVFQEACLENIYLDFSAGTSHAVGILCDARRLTLNNVHFAGFSRAGVNVADGTVVRLDVTHHGGTNCVVMCGTVSGSLTLDSVSGGAACHANGVPRGLLTLRGNCQELDIHDSWIAYGNTGVSMWGGVGLRIRDSIIIDNNPGDRATRDPLIQTNPISARVQVAGGIDQNGFGTGVSGTLKAYDIVLDNVDVINCGGIPSGGTGTEWPSVLLCDVHCLTGSRLGIHAHGGGANGGLVGTPNYQPYVLGILFADAFEVNLAQFDVYGVHMPIMFASNGASNVNIEVMNVHNKDGYTSTGCWLWSLEDTTGKLRIGTLNVYDPYTGYMGYSAHSGTPNTALMHDVKIGLVRDITTGLEMANCRFYKATAGGAIGQRWEAYSNAGVRSIRAPTTKYQGDKVVPFLPYGRAGTSFLNNDWVLCGEGPELIVASSEDPLLGAIMVAGSTTDVIEHVAGADYAPVGTVSRRKAGGLVGVMRVAPSIASSAAKTASTTVLRDTSGGAAFATLTCDDLLFPAAEATPTISQTIAASGAGVNLAIKAQQGSGSNADGSIVYGQDNGATDVSGGHRFEMGRLGAVAGRSAYMTLEQNGTAFLNLFRYSTSIAAIHAAGTDHLYLGSDYRVWIGIGPFGAGSPFVQIDQSTGVVQATGTNGGIRLQDNSVTWCEVARVAASRNVVGLCVGANLDTTKMPANTGNGVIFIGNAGTVPTAVPNSTGCGLYSEATQLRSFASTNDWEGITSLVGTGYTKTIKDRSVGDAATTSSTAIFTAGTIRAGYMTGLTGAGSAVVVVKGYRAGDVIVHRRLVNFSVVAGVPAVLNSSTLGTDIGAATTIAFDISADLRVRVTPPDSTSTKWSCTIDWEFEAVT